MSQSQELKKELYSEYRIFFNCSKFSDTLPSSNKGRKININVQFFLVLNESSLAQLILKKCLRTHRK